MSAKLTRFYKQKKAFLQLTNVLAYVMASSWFELQISVNIGPLLYGNERIDFCSGIIVQ